MDDLLIKQKNQRKTSIRNSITQKQSSIDIHNGVISSLEAKLAIYEADLATVEEKNKTLTEKIDAINEVLEAYVKKELSSDDLLKGDRIDTAQEKKADLENAARNEMNFAITMQTVADSTISAINKKIEECNSSISFNKLSVSLLTSDIQSLNSQLASIG